MDITRADAAFLNELGRRLASDKAWWGDIRDFATKDRTVIRCAGTTDGSWEVTVSDAIGALCAGGNVLPVMPKIPQDHFWQIVSQSDRWPRIAREPIALSNGVGLLDLIATCFLSSLEHAIRSELLLDYREEVAALRQIRGRLRPLQSARRYYRGDLALECEYEEFDADSPLNRVLLAATKAVATIPIFGKSLRIRARRLQFNFENVCDLKAGDLTVETDRRSNIFQDALYFAKDILRCQGRTMEGGLRKSWVFLVRTPQLIEDGIRSILCSALRDSVNVHKTGLQLEGSPLTVNPDLVFGVIAVGDVKYKLRRSDWNRQDLYQGVAFAVAYGAKNACVIGFGGPPIGTPVDAKFGEVSVASLRWNLETSPAEAERELIAQCKEWLSRIAS